MLIVPSSAPQRASSQIVRPGQVIGLATVTLQVGEGPEGGSTLSSTRTGFSLQKGTNLVLSVPSSGQSPFSALASAVAAIEPEAPPVPIPAPPTDMTEICAANCSNAQEEGRTEGGDTQPIGDFTDLKAYGYRPSRHHDMPGFDHDISVHYLSNDEVLVAFDARQLRRRIPGSWPQSVHRIVRGLLIDTHSRRVKREVEWEVEQTGQYLWPLGRGRVLVSTVGMIREYGPGLSQLESVSLPGTVEWVASAPSAGYAAIGVRRERHSRETHEMLFRLTKLDPAEDLDVRLVGPDRKTISTQSKSSGPGAPVLSDSGELFVQAVTTGRWTVHERTWDGAERIVATVNSQCAPYVSTQSRAGVFLVGCTQSDSHWYRLVRYDGTTLLKGTLIPQNIQPAVQDSEAQVFAVRVVDASHAIIAGTVLSDDTLAGERITVYRATDAHRIFSATETSFPASDANFALAPGGRQLAVLTRSGLAFYSIPLK